MVLNTGMGDRVPQVKKNVLGLVMKSVRNLNGENLDLFLLEHIACIILWEGHEYI